MAYLSLSAVMAEMNAAENEARRFLDLGTMSISLPPPRPQQDVQVKEKPTAATPLQDYGSILGGGKQ
jgi:hypothetical protein